MSFNVLISDKESCQKRLCSFSASTVVLREVDRLVAFVLVVLATALRVGGVPLRERNSAEVEGLGIFNFKTDPPDPGSCCPWSRICRQFFFQTLVLGMGLKLSAYRCRHIATVINLEHRIDHCQLLFPPFDVDLRKIMKNMLYLSCSIRPIARHAVVPIQTKG